MQCEFLVPIKIEKRNKIKIDIKRELEGERFILKGDKPFFNVLTDDSTVKLFIDAIINLEHDDAKSFISKSFMGEFDINELKNSFCISDGYKSLLRVDFSDEPKNCKTNSILIFNKEQKINNIIHLHMIREPDNFGRWKIYGIEKE